MRRKLQRWRAVGAAQRLFQRRNEHIFHLVLVPEMHRQLVRVDIDIHLLRRERQLQHIERIIVLEQALTISAHH